MRYIFSISCNIIINKMVNLNCDFTGRQQEKRYEHLNLPADFHIDKKWDTTNDLDVFAQWIVTGTNKQKDMVFQQILLLCRCF